MYECNDYLNHSVLAKHRDAGYDDPLRKRIVFILELVALRAH